MQDTLAAPGPTLWLPSVWPARHLLPGPAPLQVTAPFTANVWEVRVAVGQEVAPGDTLLVLEAMKVIERAGKGSNGDY